MRPLERLGSVKLKLGLLIVAAVGVSAAMSQIGFRLGWPIWFRPIVALVVSLVLVGALSRGMTSPLRQMAAATRLMARGDRVDPIDTRSRDEIGELARAFNSMTDDLEALETERRALVANAAHELRTPIAGLQATLENVRDGITEPTPAVIDRLSDQADRLGHIVNELLDLSRLEATDHPIRMERVEVDTVIRPAVATATADRSDVTPVIRTDPTLAVTGDASLLGRLVTNLVRNAVLHGDAHSIRVEAARSGSLLTISVSDDGPGLSMAEPARVFDRFVRGDRSRSEDRPGTGLGLAISQAIAQRHGGRIEVRNLEPTGCRFTVTLPRRSDPSPPPSNRESESPVTLPTPTQATTTLPQPPDPATRRESGPGPNNHPRAHPALFRPWRLAAIVAAAFAFGAPGNPLRSIGWSIALATLAGAAIVVTARRPAPVAFGVAGVAFIPWLAVRMSPWLITVNLMVACGLLLGAIGLPASGSLRVSLAHHLARVARAARRLRLGPLHLADEARRASSATGSGDLRRWIAAIAAGVGALAFGLAVLASGDALLASFFDAGGFAGTFTVRLFAAAAGVGGFSLLIGAAPLPGEPDAAPASRATPVLPTLFGIGGLSIAIGAYAASQVSAAVLGAAFVEERTGLTYAEYARGGFFQMVIVAFVSVALIGVARGVVRAAPETTGRVRVGCSALTVGVVATVASAVVKLAVYADTFGLTMLRVYTVVFACWLGLVAVMAYITLLRPAAPWFAPAVLVSVCVGAFAMNIADPERIVVEHNIDRSATTGKLDVDYLSQLSLDAAATVFDRLDEIEAVDDRSRYPFSRVTTPVDAREALRVDWCAKVEGAGTADAMSFNRSRARAIEAAESHCG